MCLPGFHHHRSQWTHDDATILTYRGGRGCRHRPGPPRGRCAVVGRETRDRLREALDAYDAEQARERLAAAPDYSIRYGRSGYVAAFDELKTDIGAVAASQQATKDAVLAAVATEGVRPNDHACQNQTRHIYSW